MDRSGVQEFTKHMKELLCSKLSLDSCLSILSKMKGVKKSVALSAGEILQSLECGTTFSMALRKCMALEFPCEYISFVEASEESGSLEQVFAFLLKKEEKRNVQRNRILMACIYPGFVVLIAFVMSILLVVYGSDIVPDFNGNFDSSQFRRDAIRSCVRADLFLCVCISGFAAVVSRMGHMGSRLDFFFVMKYLMESGIDFYSGLRFSIGVLQKNRRMKEMVLWSMSQVELGKSVSCVMEKFGEECVCAMEIAEATGSLTEGFQKIALLYEERNEKNFKLLESLLEPGIMCALAIYVSLLLMKVVTPILFNYGV